MFSPVQQQVFRDIKKERDFQDQKWGANRILHNQTWMTILMEEVGETAEAVLMDDTDHIRQELIQVAAVAVAHIEAIDNKREAQNGS